MACVSAVLDNMYSFAGIESHPHHTLLASFGVDTAETEEDRATLTCNLVEAHATFSK